MSTQTERLAARPPAKRPVITIFAGFGTPSDPVILQGAEALGAAGYDIVYGGGGLEGVMGTVARAAQAAGAGVTAVILEQYAHEEQLPGAAQVHVKTEQDRFAMLTTHGAPIAAFVLPGGPGTMREAMQALEKGVYEDGPPLILARVGDYLEGISQYFNAAVEAGLIRAEKADKLRRWQAGEDVVAIIAGGAGGGTQDARPPQTAPKRSLISS